MTIPYRPGLNGGIKSPGTELPGLFYRVVVLFSALILRESDTQFVEQEEGQEDDHQRERIACRGDYCCQYEQDDNSMPSVFAKE